LEEQVRQRRALPRRDPAADRASHPATTWARAAYQDAPLPAPNPRTGLWWRCLAGRAQGRARRAPVCSTLDDRGVEAWLPRVLSVGRRSAAEIRLHPPLCFAVLTGTGTEVVEHPSRPARDLPRSTSTPPPRRPAASSDLDQRMRSDPGLPGAGDHAARFSTVLVSKPANQAREARSTRWTALRRPTRRAARPEPRPAPGAVRWWVRGAWVGPHQVVRSPVRGRRQDSAGGPRT
jgi:hypothetical protein